MVSRLKIRDVEVTKLKEDHKLMIKQLGGRRSDQSQQGEAVMQVEDLCAYWDYTCMFQRNWKLYIELYNRLFFFYIPCYL